MNNKAQMITIFFSLFLILAIITILGIESANLNTNENVNSLIQAYNLPKLEYYNFLNVMSQIATINPSNATNAVFNSTIEGIYSKFFQNLNITNQGVNTNNLAINNLAESIPLLITNYQNIATPNPFQQMINISISSIDNYVNTTSFGQNVEFVYDNNSVIPSWLESYNSNYAIWWVKVPSIPAEGTMTIYMKFANKKTNLLNNKTTGEAPQLSSTYAEYDDGANVFNFYSDFKGTSLNASKWSAAGIYVVDNGIFIKNVSSSITSISSYNRGVVDFYAQFLGTPHTGGNINSYGGYSNGVQEDGRLVGTFGEGSNCETSAASTPEFYLVNFAGCPPVNLTQITSFNNNYNVFSVAATQSKDYGFINYKNLVSSGSDLVSLPFPIGVYVNTAGQSINMKWFRFRAYPPNGVMPSVQILNTPAGIGYVAPLTIINHQNIATPNPFQQEIIMNASRYSALEAPNLDNIEFLYSNGTIIPSWLESGNSSSKNAIYWLKIGRIPANSSINAFMGFASTNLNLFNGKTVGEAPQLSPTYGEYDNIVNVMNKGLEYQIYYDPSGTCDSGSYQNNVYAATLNNGVTINSCAAMSSSTASFYTSVLGSSQDVAGTTESNVVMNYQEGYSGGIAYPNPPVSNPATSWIIKAIGWAEVNSSTAFSVGSDDGIALGYSTSAYGGSGAYWLGGTSNPNNLVSEWHPEGFTAYSGMISTTGTQRIEMDYYEDGGGAYTALWSSNPIDYYSPSAPPNGVMPSTSIGNIQDIYPFEYQYSVANFTNSTSISVPGTASTGKIWNGGHAYTLTMWVRMEHAYGTCGYPCSDLFQTSQGCTSGLEQGPYNATGYQVNLLEWNSSCGTGATAQGSSYQYVPYGKWELITGIFNYNAQGNAWIASCVDTSCTNRTWTLTAPAVYSTPATILGSNQMNGQVADVQMYDSALTLNQVNQLYNEFIGAQPVYNSTLVAWIPLDGNAYDDSGNGNTASLTSVNFLYP